MHHRSTFRISHKGNVILRSLGALFFRFKKPNYFETLVGEEGLIISRLFRKTIVVPWTEIKCLDLSGLKATDYVWLKEASGLTRFLLRQAKKTRFFIVMVTHPKFLQKTEFRFVGSKIWQAGSNVFVVSKINAKDAEVLAMTLTDICRSREITLDGIVLGDI